MLNSYLEVVLYGLMLLGGLTVIGTIIYLLDGLIGYARSLYGARVRARLAKKV